MCVDIDGISFTKDNLSFRKKGSVQYVEGKPEIKTLSYVELHSYVKMADMKSVWISKDDADWSLTRCSL